ncbi:MAG: PQQ-binding-like beta-propeller repeat protein [Verrucomicrobiota bacterium]
MSLKSLLAGGVLLVGCAGGLAGEWAQYRGPQTAGVSGEKLLTTWSAAPPKCLWRVPTPAGLSSFSVSGGKVFTVVSRDVGGVLCEVCVALDAQSGHELWAVPTGVAKYQSGGDSGTKDNSGGDGPRSTPAANAGRVYVYSSDMVLHCLEAATGKPLWKKDIIAEFGGKNIGWKSAMSPLLDGDLLYVAGGGAEQSLLAFNQASGAVAWKSGSDAPTHATPVLATIHGVRQVVYMMQSGLVAVAAASGQPLWQFPFPYRICTGCSPVVAGDIVFCSAGYEIGGAACQIVKKTEGFEAKELWRVKGDNAVASLWSTPVCKDGYLYGMISFKKFGQGPLKCVDLKTGQVKWEQPGFGAGQVLLAGNGLLALADDGQLVLVDPSPDAYKEVARLKTLPGKCWSSPALSNGRLYVRSTKEGACFDVSPGR